jgi:NADH:ubiquinone oxidoreductase subunit B-like Fe-S oxidoreductase
MTSYIIKTLNTYSAYTRFVEYVYNIGTGNLHIMALGSCKFSENKYSQNRTSLKGKSEILPLIFYIIHPICTPPPKKIYIQEISIKILTSGHETRRSESCTSLPGTK